MVEEWAGVAWPAKEGADTGECTGDPRVMGSMTNRFRNLWVGHGLDFFPDLIDE